MNYISKGCKSVTKRFIGLFLILVLLLTTFTSTSTVKAAALQIPNVKTTIVSDLDTAKFPSTYTSFGYYLYNGTDLVIPIDLTNLRGGTVKVWFAINSKVSGGGQARITDNYTIYSSYSGTYNIDSNRNTISAWLEGGKVYYCVLNWSGIAEKEFIANDDFAVAVLYEDGNSEEMNPINDKNTPNILTKGVATKGFISYNSGRDYYLFTVTNNTAVTLTYSFDGSRNDNGSGNITVYDSNGISVIKQTTVDRNSANRYNDMSLDLGTLKAGNYIIEMSGLYGRTSIKYDTTNYDIKFRETTDEKTGKTHVQVLTEFDYSEINCVNEEIPEMFINSNEIWNNSYEKRVPVVNGKFEVETGGTYTVRVIGKNGKSYLATYNTAYRDNEGPTITGVANGEAYKKGKTIKFNDDSGIKSATLNGRNIKSGIRISEEGEYTLIVTDNANNTVKITFWIDYTAPVIIGFQNGKTYSTGGLLGWEDNNMDGIAYVLIDGKEADVKSVKEQYISTAGTHNIIVRDKAGNETTCKFTIGL